MTDETLDITLEEAKGPERELVCRMLERPITDKLKSLRNTFWKDTWTLFYYQTPANSSANYDIINAYRGFKFGVVLVEGKGPYLAVDVKTRYVGRKPLSEYSREQRNADLQNHLDLGASYKERARFLRDNGAIKIPCKYTGETGETISRYAIDEHGTTVLDYYLKKYSQLKINPDDLAVFAKDREDNLESLPVPSSRLFPIFTTEYEGVRTCAVRPQMTPYERFSAIQDFLKYLRGIRYGDIPITVSDKIFITERTVFIPPKLEFGNGSKLQPFQNNSIPPVWDEQFDSQIVKWRSKKLPVLYQNGPTHNEPLPGIVLLYPQSMERSMRETFIKDLKQEIKLQTGQDIQIIQQRVYPIGKEELMGGSLLIMATEIRSTIPRCLTIVILWNKFHQNIHGYLKDAIRPTLSQCVWENTVHNICNRNNPQRAQSQIRNLALGVITEAGVKPWVLADPLHHDLHIGIDLLYGRIGYHFLYGLGGRIIQTFFGRAMKRGRMHEAIKRPEFRARLVQSIKSIVNQGYGIKSVIIHRDGRWWQSESAGLNEALRLLKSDGTLPQDVRCAVVEVRKNHMPVRLFTSLSSTELFFMNPLPGTYFMIDSNRILLTPTGRPGAWDNPGGKTASTLLLEVVETIGHINTKEVAEDAYRLTHLNWNAPDIEISLPVTIRWTDEALRETLISRAEEDTEESKECVSNDETEVDFESG